LGKHTNTHIRRYYVDSVIELWYTYRSTQVGHTGGSMDQWVGENVVSLRSDALIQGFKFTT